MCYAEDATSLSTWSFLGFAFAAALAISAVILYIVYKVYKLIKDMKGKMAEAEENMKSLREEVHGMHSRQNSLTAKVDQMYEVSTEFFNELDDRVKQQQQLTGHVWMGFARVGGWISNTRRFLDPEKQRYLTHLNNENMDDYEKKQGARSLRSRSSRRSTPTRRSFAEDGEGPSSILEPPTEYGPPQTTSELEPHGLPKEVHPKGQPDEEVGPVVEHIQELQEQTNRMQALLRELREQQENVAMVGDEIEAERIGTEITRIETFMLSLPRSDKCFESEGGVRTIAFHTYVSLVHVQTMS